MNQADSIIGTINITIDDDYLDYKDTFIKSLKKEYEKYNDEYGISPKYEETQKGLKMTFTASNNKFQKLMSLSNDENSYKSIKSYLEKEKFTCK